MFFFPLLRTIPYALIQLYCTTQNDLRIPHGHLLLMINPFLPFPVYYL